MPVNHWTHKFAETPFGCNYAATNGCDMIKKFILFILGLTLIPVLFIGLPIIIGIGYGIFGGFYLIYIAFSFRIHGICEIFLKLVIICFSFVGFGIAVGLGTVGGAIGSAFGALFVIPAIIFHFYLFIRSVIWWRKNLGSIR